jgi:hypothetical protein
MTSLSAHMLLLLVLISHTIVYLCKMTMSVVQLLLRVLIMLPHVTLKTIILDNNIVSKAVEVDDGPQTFRIWLSLVFPPC